MRKCFEPRMAHSACLSGYYLVLFGGYTSQSHYFVPPTINLLSFLGCSDYILSESMTLSMIS